MCKIPHPTSKQSEHSLIPFIPFLLIPYDSGPVLCVGDVKIGQSKAIERYVARLCNMMGSNDIESAQIDCVTEHIRDIKDKYNKVKGTTDATEKETQLAKWFDTEFAEWLEKVRVILLLSYHDDHLFIC